ncbi:MAG: vanadium-dependent haloperoxidase, partial [Myxococcota bacterium]
DVALPDDLPLDGNGELPALLKVWGRAADDVYAVGGNGVALHYDGAAWSVVETGTTARLFTVNGNADRVVLVGGDSTGVLLSGDAAGGFVDQTPDGAPVLQGLTSAPGGQMWVTGGDAAIFRSDGDAWTFVPSGQTEVPESLHGAWHDGTSLWAVGGAVLSGALNEGAIWRTEVDTPAYEPDLPTTVPDPVCPTEAIDREPDGSIARRWNEQLLDSIRRDIPRPGVHARNLFHVSVAMWDAWATYDDTADGWLYEDRTPTTDPDGDRQIAISYAAYRVLHQRYSVAIGGATSVACYDAFMDVLGLDPTDTHTDGDDPIAVGNRIGQTVIDATFDDGANEAGNYADTTGWVPENPPIAVDSPGVGALVDVDEWTPLNIALAETQNGIVLDSGLQGYICPTWAEVQPFAIPGPLDAGAPPSVSDPEMKDWALDVIRKTAWLDVADDTPIDLSPGAYGNNTLGENDGTGHPENPVTGQPYAANPVKRSDFGRVLAEFWADGPKSETPPGHWNVLANDVSDALDPDLRIGGGAEVVDRLEWDASLYLALNGAVHDAAITAWGIKRQHLAARPIQYIRWMAEHGQSSDPSQPSYDPDGLPLEPGLVEVITADSAAPGERHWPLRWFVGEVAVYTWLGEPGDRANDVAGNGWMRAVEWIPYQRRTFVTPAFPGFISGHSTFSRSAAELLAEFTGSPYFPGGLGEFVASPNAYLVFEDGPSEEVRLQWATFYDAADQAGQSRIWGGIHIWPDDQLGRTLGSDIGAAAFEQAVPLFDGSYRP